MIKESQIIDSYLFLRKENQTIPSEVLEFIKKCMYRKNKRIKK